MARIRTIKPEFFTSADVCALTPLARLLFIGLWGVADREGRMKWRPADFKLQILPADKCDIEAICGELVSQGLVVLYGEGFAYIPSFTEHQSVNPREQASRFPEPPAVTPRIDASNPDLNAQRGKEGKGKEGNDSVAKATGAAAPAKDVIFAELLPWLNKRAGKDCRSLVGKWLSETRDDSAVRAVLEDCERENPVDPVAWLSARFKPKAAPETWDQRRIREGMEALRQ